MQGFQLAGKWRPFFGNGREPGRSQFRGAVGALFISRQPGDKETAIHMDGSHGTDESDVGEARRQAYTLEEREIQE